MRVVTNDLLVGLLVGCGGYDNDFKTLIGMSYVVCKGERGRST